MAQAGEVGAEGGAAEIVERGLHGAAAGSDHDGLQRRQHALAVGLGFSDDNRPTVYSVVTLRDTIENATINLLGPLLINWRDHVGAQITLHDTNYSARQALFPERLPLDKKRSRVVAAVPAHQAAVDMRREAIG